MIVAWLSNVGYSVTKALSMLVMELKKRLKLAREQLGWTQQEAGDRAGVSANMIYMYEAGQRNPSTLALKGLAALYGKSVEWFFGKEDESVRDSETDDIDIADPEISLFFRGEWEEFDEEEKEFIKGMIRESRELLRKRREGSR